MMKFLTIFQTNTSKTMIKESFNVRQSSTGLIAYNFTIPPIERKQKFYF